jgi:hypothetical protein
VSQYDPYKEVKDSMGLIGQSFQDVTDSIRDVKRLIDSTDNNLKYVDERVKKLESHFFKFTREYSLGDLVKDSPKYSVILGFVLTTFYAGFQAYSKLEYAYSYIQVLEQKVKGYDDHMIIMDKIQTEVANHKRECERQWMNHRHIHLLSDKKSDQRIMLDDQEDGFTTPK